MRPITIAIPASAATAPIPLDIYQIGPVEWAVLAVSGVVDIDVQYTFDDIYAAGYNPATGNWKIAGGNGETITAAAAERLLDVNDQLITPTAVRFSNAGVGTATGRIVQSGVMG